LEEWVGLAFFADEGGGAVAGEDARVVGEGEKMGVDGAEEGGGVASGEVGAADGAGEEGIAGEEEVLVGEVEADAALGVTGGVEDVGGDALLTALRRGTDGDQAAVIEAEVRGGDVGGGDAEPAGLDVHHADEREVALVVEDGSAGEGFEVLGAGDVVDVGVGDDDLLGGEAVLGEESQDAADVVAGVDDDGFAGGLVAEDGAVALEGADAEDFVDHEVAFLRLRGLVAPVRFATDVI